MKCNLETIKKALFNHQEQQHAVSFSKLKGEIDGFEKELREIIENRPRLTDEKYIMLDEIKAFDMFINDNHEYWEKAKKEILKEKELIRNV